MLHNCSDSISIARIQYETRFPSKHHRPHLIRVLADQLRSVTKARAQYEIIPLIEIRILRLIDPKISKLVFFTNHQNHRITPQLATVGEKKENAYLCIPCPRCINWAEPSANFSNKISSISTHLVHLVI